MKKKIAGVAFDLEGAIVDVEEAHHQGHLAVARDVGVHLTIDSALKKIPHFIGGPNTKIAEEIWNLSDKKYSPEFIYKRDKYYYFKLLPKLVIKPRPGFMQVLKKLRSLGLKTCIGSSTVEKEAKILLKKSDLNKIFSRKDIVFREDVIKIKPAPDVYLETARRMRIQPGDQLVFDDSPRGIQAALAIGSRAIGMPVYDKRITIKQLKTAGAEKIYKNWREIDIKKLFI